MEALHRWDNTRQGQKQTRNNVKNELNIMKKRNVCVRPHTPSDFIEPATTSAVSAFATAYLIDLFLKALIFNSICIAICNS